MPEQIRFFFNRRNLPAWVILCICLCLLVFAQYTLLQQVTDQAEKEFDEQSHLFISTIVKRLNQHEQILLGGVGLFNASTSVERDEWHDYVARLQLTKTYPGIQGIGFSQIIRPEELAAHTARVRAEGFPEYAVRPPGERALYTSIIYLEPFSGRNLAAFGYDMMSEETRAKGLRLAVDENETVITSKVKLVQETQGKPQAGFLMYVPVYRKHMPVDTAAERWAALEGFVYSPYRMNDLMRGIMGQQIPQLDFTIHDGETADDNSLMYNSAEDADTQSSGHTPRFRTQLPLYAYKHNWTVLFRSRPEFEAGYPLSLNIPMLIMGGGTSILVFLLISLLIMRRSQAEKQTLLLEETVSSRTGQLSEALKFLTAMLDNAGHAVIVTNTEGIITVFNNKAETMLGYPAEEIVNKKTPAVFHDLQEVVTRARIFSAELGIKLEPGFEVFVAKSRRHLPNEYEWTYVRKDGSRFPVFLTITAIHNNENTITGFLGIAADISAQKMAEQALRENAEHLQAILDNVVDGIITINEQGVIQSYNQSAETIFGYTSKEVIGNNINMLMPEPYQSAHDGYLENYRATGVARIIGIGREVEGQRKDGSIFPLDLAISQSTHQGQPIFIGLVRDITERKRIEKMKSEFVSTVSHELRTPLTAISGSLGLITGGALGEIPAQARQMIELAHKNSLRLTTLINDLLDMEKLVAGRMHFDMKIQALMPLLEQNIQSIQSYAEQYQVRFELLSRTDDILVRVDGIRLQQVFSNFLSNAAKFSPPQGQVEISVRQISNFVRVEITDHGPGIPAEFRNRIFQKFSQADSSDTRKKGGTGLGLAISKELIERMNGRIGFDSVEGQGACFYFELPIERKKPAIATTQNHNMAGAPHLLVVDDDPDIASLFSIMLNDAGYNVDIAPTAEMALAYLDQHKYDAITIDLQLPDQSGANLMRVIRSQPRTEKLPIVVISAHCSDGKFALDNEFSSVDWLEKPVSAKQLTDAIQRALPKPPSQKKLKPRVLHVEDDAIASRVVTALGQDMADIDCAPTLTDARNKLKLITYDLIVIDAGLPDGNGLDLLPELESLTPKPRAIILSGKEIDQKHVSSGHTVLIKSRTSNDVIMDTLKQMLGGNPDHG